MLDVAKIKQDFPIFKRQINGHDLVYLDSTNSSQKPLAVIKKMHATYENHYANIHRGVYTLSEESTTAYENCRALVAQFINAADPAEIIFTKSCTEAINLVAYCFGQSLKPGDEIIVSQLEHHSNLVPWQELCQRSGAQLRVIPLKPDFTLDMEAYGNLLNDRTRLVAITAMSNVTGTIPPLQEIITRAHQHNAKVLVDGAQSVAHAPTDVQALDCDFLTFSSHKMLGPSGVGVLYGKKEVLEEMPPFLFGGDMIAKVDQFSSTYADLPAKFEAGTPNIEGVIALAEAIKYLQAVGLTNIAAHEKELAQYAHQKLQTIPGLKLYTASTESPVISFTLDGIHPHDIASILDSQGIAIRAGHHCAQPLMQHFQVPALARASLYLYNDHSDIDKLLIALQKTQAIFA